VTQPTEIVLVIVTTFALVAAAASFIANL